MRRPVIALAVLVAASMAGLPRTAVAQDDATRSRFGGTADAFAEKYGEPTSSVAHPSRAGTTVLTYAVFGFQDVTALVYDGAVVGLALRPVAGETWTTDAVQTVMTDFAPSDAEYDDVRLLIGPSDAGVQIAIRAASDGVADQVEPEAYAELEAGGEPGDLHAVLFAVPGGRYSGVSLNLGAAETAALSGTVVDVAWVAP